MPVTHGVAGSSPVRTASEAPSKMIRGGFSFPGNETPTKTPTGFSGSLGTMLKNMATATRKYKEPKIVRAKRGWFIKLPFLWPENHPSPNGKTHKVFEISGGVNRIHDLREREALLKAMLKELKSMLENGFDPFFEHEEQAFAGQIAEKKAEIQQIEQAEQHPHGHPAKEGWSLRDGMEKFIGNCRERNLAPKTIASYQSFINNITEWLTAWDLLETPCCEFDEFRVKEFLTEFYDEEDWSPRTYNNHIDFFITLFNRVQKLEKLEAKEKKLNREVKYVIDMSNIEPKRDNAEKNRYYTPTVQEQVKNEARKDSRLYNYIRWIYYSCMRPKEIRLLQVKHIDLKARQIKVTGPTGKTGERFVPICDELFDLIGELGIMKLPLNFHPFGRGGVPSEYSGNKDTFSEIYRPIKERLGLDDKYTLYGWKHTRVVNLLMAGFTDAEVMSLTGHLDYESFKAYKRSFKLDTTVMQGKTLEF